MKHKILWAFALLLLICGIALFLTARYADRIVDPYVRSLVEDKKPMNHRIDYRDIRVNLISRLIKIKDARIYPDSSLIKDEHIWMEINVDQIKLTDFNILDLLLHKTLVIGDFILLNPLVEVNLPIRVTQEAIQAVEEDTSIVTKSPLLTKISLERMILSGGSFRLIQNNVILASSDDINFIARQINLVKNSKEEPIGYTYGDVKFNLSNIKLHSETGLYEMSLEKLSVDKIDSSLVLSGFKMKPKYDKNEFSGKLKAQTDRFDVEISSIKINGIGYRRLLDGQPLQITEILLDGINADIFRDKNVSFDFNRRPLFYNESFLKISIPLIIDTFNVTNSTILYNELAEGRTEPGLIRLEDFNLQSGNLTNHLQFDSLDYAMKFDIQAKVMGEGPMNVKVILPLEGDLRKFEVSGSVGTMNISPVNAMLEPSMNIKFKGGTVTRMTFAFNANDDFSNGWMEFLYKDLDVELMKKDQDKEKGFLSFMANSVANSNNPQPGKDDFKSVEIGFERDKSKGIIGFIWKTIQSGMVRTILPISKYNIDQKQIEQKKTEKDKSTQKKQEEDKSGKKKKK
jgi:hypothetical protein